jgi:dolichol-phosphate mannosyltransferase
MVLVVIPTYQERETLPETIERTRLAAPEVDILVADDASPDGTGQVADALRARDPHVHVLHRARKEGLGDAYVAGFRWALDRRYDVVVEMDADGSHRPEDLPRLLGALAASGADLVVGSRWVPGGSVVNWPRSREVLSRLANLYTRLSLGLPVQDAAGGYRAYRSEALKGIDLDTIHSHGYCFQVDMTRRIHAAGGSIVERPITFVERRAGQSKMSRAIVVEALWRITLWGVLDRTRFLTRRLSLRPGSTGLREPSRT